METELVSLNIVGITYNQIENGMYALILEDGESRRRLPIIIGYNEAQSIECILQNITTPRPLTHEFASKILESFTISIEKVIIKKMPNGIFAADVSLSDGNRNIILDARSSDAIALALRMKAPIYTSRELMESCGIERESMRQGPGHVITNRSIPAREALERVKRTDNNPLERLKLPELENLLAKAVETEDYEKAEEIKLEIDRRQNKNTPQS